MQFFHTILVLGALAVGANAAAIDVSANPEASLATRSDPSCIMAVVIDVGHRNGCTDQACLCRKSSQLEEEMEREVTARCGAEYIQELRCLACSGCNYKCERCPKAL